MGKYQPYLPLLLIVFIDATGIGILFPIMNTVIMSPHDSILPLACSAQTRDLLYGLTIGSFFIAWFIGATYIAKISDGIGRKKCLFICLFGMFIGYGLTAVAIIFKNIAILILSRLIAGLTAGSQPVAQAAMIDISDKKNKTGNLGLIMFAFSLGMVSGPIISAVFTNKALSAWFSMNLPFYIVMALCVLTFFLLTSFQDPVQAKSRHFRFDIRDIYRQFAIIFTSRHLTRLSLAFFIMQFGMNTFYIFISVFLYQKYRFSTFDNGINLFIMGLAMAISNIWLVPRFSSRFNPQILVIVCLFIMLISTALLLLNNSYLPYFVSAFFMLAFALAYTNMLSLFSSSVSDQHQGWIMGITVSLFTLGSFLTSMLTQALLNIDMNFPIFISMIAFIMAIFVLACRKGKESL